MGVDDIKIYPHNESTTELNRGVFLRGIRMDDICEKIINDPNSTFNAEDKEELRKLSPEVLQRLYLGMGTATPSEPVPVTNEETQKAELEEGLRDCQQDIADLLAAERELREGLYALTGEQIPSIIAQYMPKPKKEEAELTEKAVMDFVETSPTITGVVLREALVTRDEKRKEAIDVIVANSAQYTVDELRAKVTSELNKLVGIVTEHQVNNARREEYNDLTWDGAGLADRNTGNLASSYRYGAPLELPTTLPEKLQ